MEPFHLSDAAAGPVIAATITSLISFLGMIISKEHKTSEFRQDWINQLRAEISEYISQLYTLMGCELGAKYAAGSGAVDSKKFWDEAKEHFMVISKCTTSIRLRLNPKEKSNLKFLSYLEEFEVEFNADKTTDADKIMQIVEKFVPEAHYILKKEWNKVRRGEMIFFLTKYVFLIFLFIGISVLIYPSIHETITKITTQTKETNTINQKTP